MSDVRRFFLDDGSARKQWHLQVKGKSQIVRFGRLGGSLREARKSFQTPAEVVAESEKLIAAKKREGYVEIDPTRLEIVRR
jgi:predicted DNA-binding WGR domain protein